MVYNVKLKRTLYFLRSAKEIYLYHRLTTCRNFYVENREDRVLWPDGQTAKGIEQMLSNNNLDYYLTNPFFYIINLTDYNQQNTTCPYINLRDQKFNNEKNSCSCRFF